MSKTRAYSKSPTLLSAPASSEDIKEIDQFLHPLLEQDSEVLNANKRLTLAGIELQAFLLQKISNLCEYGKPEQAMSYASIFSLVFNGK